MISGQCSGPVPASACVVSNRGVRSPRNGPRAPVPSRSYRLGKTERVNESESLMMPRYDSGSWVECVKGRTELAVAKRQVPTNDPVLVGRAPLLRGIEGTQTGRILHVWNVETPLESRHGNVW